MKRRATPALARPVAVAVLALVPHQLNAAGVFRTETFDTDPNWDGHNNRVTTPPPQQVTQNFGFTITNFAGAPGDTTGEVGGRIMSAGEAAYYGKSIAPLTFDHRLSASGNLFIQTAGHHTLLGLFKNDTVEPGWRNANHFALRLQEEGTGAFKAWVDYSTGLWRAGGVPFRDQSGNDILFSTGQAYQWSIDYYPDGNNGNGSFEGTISNSTIGTRQTGLANLAPGRKLDGTTLNRFGLFNSVTHYDDRAGNLWIDDLVINNSAPETFAQNPGWDGLRNNTTYITNIIRPKFNFGYSATGHAGGAGSGEMGGFTFKGDSRSEFKGSRMAYYGDPLDQTLTLDNALKVSGKVSLKRGITDSITHIGFFHSTDSIRTSDQQTMHWPENFVGVSIEGPSDEGFFFYPTYGLDPEGMGSVSTRGENPPRIYPNGESLDWAMEYDPNGNGALGRIVVTLEGQQGYLNLAPGHKQIGAHFDRMGIITSHVDGNGQEVYFDDLTYTVAAAAGSQWLLDASGSWLDAANWSGGVPDGVGATANFGGAITGARLIHANAPVTVGTINFDDDNSYRLGGLGDLTISVVAGTASINVHQGSHTINLPLNIASNTELNVAAGAELVLSDPVTVMAGKSLLQAGEGTVTYQTTVRVQGNASISFGQAAEVGTLALSADATAEVRSSGDAVLTVASLAIAPSARVDIHDNTLIIKGGNYDAIREKVRQGFDGDDWSGNGITSSAAASDPTHATGLGVVEQAGEVVVKYTFYGDGNLDGIVDLDDFRRFESAYGNGGADASLATWLNGDFDYSTGVTPNDFDLFLIGMKHQRDPHVSAELYEALIAFATREGLDVARVPEPSALGLLGACAFGLSRRRRPLPTSRPAPSSPNHIPSRRADHDPTL